MRMRALWIVASALLVAAPSFAADRVIQNGIDVWRTTEDGSTFAKFQANPIPAGFFCTGSPVFSGNIPLRGVPIVTGTPGELGRSDTIVQRLDDAAFKKGVAVTRLQFRAMHLQSIKPFQTPCGAYDVHVKLDGVQPVTRMVIRQENANGGTFLAPLQLITKISFTPVGRASNEILELPAQPIRFPAQPIAWAKPSGPVAPKTAFVRVDTDGDRVPDTFLPGTSNFLAGRPSQKLRAPQGAAVDAATYQEQLIFHEDSCATHVVN